jgi:hypothetical protein
MTDNIYEIESHHTPESRDRDARLVGHEAKDNLIGRLRSMGPDGRSIAGWHTEPVNPDGEEAADRIEALLAERDTLKAENQRLRESAERWDALVGSQRLRIMGAAGFVTDTDRPYPDPDRGEGWLHFGLEVWDKHPADPEKYPQEQCRALLTSYVDHRRAALKGDKA